MVLTRDEFAREFPAEGQHIEFKQGVGTDPLQKSIVAFSNAEGGVILIGVDDDGGVRGRELDSGTTDAIHRTLRAVRDPGRYQLHSLLVESRPVVILSVARREEGFAQASNGTVRARRGSMDEPIFGPELARLISERSTTRFESCPASLSIDEIDRELASELARAFDWQEEMLIERLHENGYATDDRLTIAGALYLVTDPGAALGKAYVEILRYRDETDINYDRRDEIAGPLHRQLQSAVERIQDELGTELVVVGVRRHELSRVPEVVVRETIANALAHRSYELDRTAVRVEIRPASIRITSPGGLPEPVTVENMREASAPRNLAVIKALRRFGLAEDAGRGIDVIEDTMQEEMLDPPIFEDHGHEVAVTLPIRSAVAPTERAWISELEERGTLRGSDRLVLVHAARGEALTNSSVRVILQVDANDARDTLQRLRDEGFLDQRGERGGATYYLSGSLQPPAGLRLGQKELEGLVEQLAADGPISNADVREATGLDRLESLAILNALVVSGRLKRSGARRGTRYSLP